MSSAATSATASIVVSPAVRMVLHRVNSASLLVDNVSRRVQCQKGMIIYLSFFDGINENHISKAVKLVTESKIFAFPSEIVSEARPKPASLLDDKSLDVMVIPQASICGKIKNKAVQYHSQAKKETGQELYALFIQQLRQTLLPKEIVPLLDLNGELPKKEKEEEKEEGDEKNEEEKKETSSARHVVNGTYGNTQALSIDSPGPMTHVFDVDL